MSNPMASIDLDYLSRERDRHGNIRWYFRRAGRRIRIRETPGTVAFMVAYEAAKAQTEPAVPKTQPNTFEWLGALYLASSEFKRLDARSQRLRASILKSCFAEPFTPGSDARFGQCPVAALEAKHVKALRDKKASLPGAANNRLKYLSSMFTWAVENDHMKTNPARDVKPLGYESDGFHTWTIEEIRQFTARHPLGTKAHLALALLFYTGARRGDAIHFGRQHVRSGVLRFVPSKTKHLRSTAVEFDVHPALTRIIAASPTGDMTFLVTEAGNAFTPAGFGNWFRDRCNEAGLRQCSAHGLRKALATLVAERGGTDRQLMALHGWSTPAQATTYTRAADKRRLATDALALLGDDCLTGETDGVSPIHNTLKNKT
jgi:integrase